MIVPLSSGRYSSGFQVGSSAEHVQCLRFSFGDPEFEPILGGGKMKIEQCKSSVSKNVVSLLFWTFVFGTPSLGTSL